MVVAKGFGASPFGAGSLEFWTWPQVFLAFGHLIDAAKNEEAAAQESRGESKSDWTPRGYNPRGGSELVNFDEYYKQKYG